ncbi:MAG: fibro-slime domain-containing protein [Polyangiales bacterium]
MDSNVRLQELRAWQQCVVMELKGTEHCDDGNNAPFDGCDPNCENEPNCSAGSCVAVCGDGVILPGTSEACDDGNTNDGDGCSSTCTVEEGFQCELVPIPLPDPLRIPVIYRDFRGYNDVPANPGHIDFNNPSDSNGGIAFNITADLLDSAGLPTFSGENTFVQNSNEGPPHSSTTFSQWYRTSSSSSSYKNVEIVKEMVLDEVSNNTYKFASATNTTPQVGGGADDFSQGFFPIDGEGFTALAMANPLYEPMHEGYLGGNHNFSFTSEVRYWFEYAGDEVLSFSGDDDLWVFVDGFLCLDVGGLHPAVTGVMSFLNPAVDNAQQSIVQSCKNRLEVGKPYELAIFHAERHTGASNFSLTLQGFVSERSECAYECGDGIVTRFEFCDDGPGQNTGEYGHCNANCTALGPHCGDGMIAANFEDCDDGESNNGAYNGCNPDCTFAPFCGDGIRQPEFGEGCDAGSANGTSGSGCSAVCQFVLE